MPAQVRQQEDHPVNTTLILSLSCVILLGTLMPPVDAGEIVFTTPQKAYAFATGDEAVIPIGVQNTCGHDVFGTLVYSMQHVQEGGEMANSDQVTRTQSFTIFSDLEAFELNIGSQDAPSTLTLDISFKYSEGTTYQVSLECITVYFDTEVPSEELEKSPLTSTQTEQTGGSASGTSQESAQYAPVLAGTTAGTISSQIQQPADMTALKEQLECEAREKQLTEESFASVIRSDLFFIRINESLSEQDFRQGTMDLQPTTPDSGMFSLEYTQPGIPSAWVAGTVERGSITSMEISSSHPLSVAFEISSNPTYVRYDSDLKQEGYQRVYTTIDATPDSCLTILRFLKNGDAAWLNATLVNGTVTGITLEREESGIPYLVPLMVFLVTVGIAALVFTAYYRYWNEDAPFEKIAITEQGSYRDSVQALLKEAEALCVDGHMKEAYGKIGQALRMFIAHEKGKGGIELTDEEALALLKTDERSAAECGDILCTCSNVMFARSLPPAEEFARLLEKTEMICLS
jgi:hypothetical protein